MGATTPPAPAPNPPARPPATFADIAFGPHVHHRLTARQSPKSRRHLPTPLMGYSVTTFHAISWRRRLSFSPSGNLASWLFTGKPTGLRL